MCVSFKIELNALEITHEMHFSEFANLFCRKHRWRPIL